MSDIAERYNCLAGGFLARIQATPEDRWDSASPSQGWTARDVVAHVINGHRAIIAVVRGTRPQPTHGVGVSSMAYPPKVEPDADLAAAFTECRAGMLTVLTHPHLASRTFPTPLGIVTVQEAADAVGALELLAHTWDLARAVGGDESLPPEAVTRTYQSLQPHYEELQATGGFRPEVAPPEDADPQTKFLCFAGRQP